MINKANQEMDDAKLNSTGQQTVRQIVKAMPEDSLSMAWRSSLNEQLLQVAVKQKKRQRWLGFVKPAVGLSFAMALAGVVLFMPSRTSRLPGPIASANRGLESAIITDHRNSALMNEVSSAGLNANEAKTEANSEDPDEGNWSESDVESL